ncbi:hypothetical protein KM043_016529 [Ampulex compressa]|nr:hypothetical protein KM043_016529 [Ampulex compressa]
MFNHQDNVRPNTSLLFKVSRSADISPFNFSIRKKKKRDLVAISTSRGHVGIDVSILTASSVGRQNRIAPWAKSGERGDTPPPPDVAIIKIECTLSACYP